MAAGQGTRMRSALPKVLHPVCGRPMVLWPIAAARAAGADRVIAVLSPGSEVAGALPEGVEVAIQPEQRGTGDAVAAAADLLSDDEELVVLAGDQPLITGEFVAGLLAAHRAAGAAATLTTAVLDDPSGYGRIVRSADGAFERVVETKSPGDASQAELAIREVNAAVYAFRAGAVLTALREVRADNAQAEVYLPDAIPQIRDDGLPIAVYASDDTDALLGVNTRVELARAQEIRRRRILEAHMLAGVTVTDPASTVVEADVTIGEDAVIEPGSFLRGRTQVAGGATVGPVTTLIDTRVGAGSSVVHSYLVDCDVLERCVVGPFTYIRPGTTLRDGARAGAFVELKNSDVGAGTKIPHLSYVGDADVGEQANIAAGNITANYDGHRKHRTVIGDRVRTGVDTTFVAPVRVGDDAYTGAGSVIVEDVPQGALGIARARQENVEGYAESRQREIDEETKEGLKQ